MNITYKSPAEIASMKIGGQILGKILLELAKMACPGMTTRHLDQKARELLKQYGAKASFLGYHGFPGVLCTPVNEEVVHTIPNERPLKDGDLLTLDFGVIYDDLHTDSAISIGIGKIDGKKKKLIQTAETALAAAISKAGPGIPVKTLSHEIQKTIEQNGYSVIRELIGHGVGKNLHEDPPIPNFEADAPDFKLRPGMTIAIEPIFSAGKRGIKTLEDNWNIVTMDGSLAIQVEHSIAITEKGCEVLTKREALDPVYQNFA